METNQSKYWRFVEITCVQWERLNVIGVLLQRCQLVVVEKEKNEKEKGFFERQASHKGRRLGIYPHPTHRYRSK